MPSRPVRWPPCRTGPISLRWLSVWKITSRRRAPRRRLLVFVDYVAHQAPASSPVLHRWIDEVGERLSLSEPALRELCVATTARLASTGQVFLAVQLTPDAIDPDRFLASIWLQRDGEAHEPLLRDDQPRTLAELSERLHELIRDAPAMVGVDVGDLVIEFILPRSLINEPVDQWRMDKVLPHRLGTRHPVVIRSLDRMCSAELHAPWRSKWRWLTRHGHQADPGAIHWLRSRAGHRGGAAFVLLDDRPAALAMAFAPDNSADLKADELTAGLYAGVPVIVWCRDERGPEQFRREFARMMAGRGLAELPAVVHRLRLEADHGTEHEHLGRHLTVLYDDADRLPDIYRRPGHLRAP